jgi:hypothetical protein
MEVIKEADETRENPALPLQQFKIGYHQIHPDVGLNYQMNRFSDGSDQMLAQMTEVAPRIHNFSDWIREFLALSGKAYAEKELYHAALYLRSAEFYMPVTDARKTSCRLCFVQWIKEYYHVTDANHFNIPFENITMNAYRFLPEKPVGTIVLFGGFDSYIEELFSMQLYFFQNGFDVITFDGPGQGTPLEEQQSRITPDWHKPVKAVLDHFNLNDVTLMGYSLGGCLVLRAAAHEPRVSRVVCADILTDFFQAVLKKLPPVEKAVFTSLMKLDAAPVVNALIYHLMKENMLVESTITQGLHVTGTATPFEFLKKTL